jgi:hypothetical protein
MRQKTSKPTSAQGFDQAWKRFHEENFGLDEVPPGWINAYQYAEINDVTTSSASCFLRRAVEEGKAISKNYRLRNSKTGIRTVTHFKLTP